MRIIRKSISRVSTNTIPFQSLYFTKANLNQCIPSAYNMFVKKKEKKGTYFRITDLLQI